MRERFGLLSSDIGTHALLTDRSSTASDAPPIPFQTTQPAPPAHPRLSRWRRALSALGAAVVAAAALSLLAWIVALFGTDRSLYLQYLYWFDAALALGGLVLLSLGLLLRHLGRSLKRRNARLAAVAAGLVLAVVVGRTWGVFRVIANLSLPSPPKGGAIRVVHWNLSQYNAPERIEVGDQLSAEGTPDIALVSMQNNRRIWDQISAAMSAGGSSVTLVNAGIVKVFSTYPVRSVGAVSIPLSGADGPANLRAAPWMRSALRAVYRIIRVQGRSVDNVENATVVAFVFDTEKTVGRKTTAWFIDLPSNVLVSRADIAEHVAARTGQMLKAGTLPAPDFIIGDFNTPAGSASLSMYAPGFTDAVRTAGLGRLATWPRPSTLLHIDHLLVSPAWHAAEYRVMDIGAGEHLAQTALLWPDKNAPAPKQP